MKKINFGIVGTGQMAATMVNAMRLMPNIEIVAVCGASTERASAFADKFGISNVYALLDEMLSQPNIDAIYIANANAQHAASTIASLQKGKAVLCEKPIAISEDECQQIISVANATGKLCMEAMWTHCLPAYQALFEMNKKEVLGKALHLYADFGYPVNPLSFPRMFANTAGNGVLLDRAVYPISMAIRLLGDVKSVRSEIAKNTNGLDTHADLMLTHENGGQTQLAVSFQTLLQNRATLSCENGNISLEPPLLGAETLLVNHVMPDSGQQADSSGLKSKLKEKFKQSAFLRFLKMKMGGKSNFYSYGKNQYLPLLQHFCALYEAEKIESDLLPLSLSAQVLRVITQARKD